MLIEFNHTYTVKTPIEKIYNQSICGKLNAIKLIKESNVAVPEIENKYIEFLVDGEIYNLNKIKVCRIKHVKYDDDIKTNYISEVSDTTIDGRQMTIDEIYKTINDWFKEE